MCKSCQYCFESCYWHLIEKRFCFDESIALFEEPIKYEEEKNNNQFDNIAFFDSVSVIAGRAIVTIDPLEVKEKLDKPITSQPRLRWQEKIHQINEINKLAASSLSKSVPVVYEESLPVKKVEDELDASPLETSRQKPFSTSNIPEEPSLKPKIESSKSTGVLLAPDPQIRKKSLQERRMSKSLYLRLDLPNKEVPIIRQHSVPKFFLDTPEDNQTTYESALVKNQSQVLTSPVSSASGFTYDLYSIVQMAKAKSQEDKNKLQSPAATHHSTNRLIQIKERIKLRKTKSMLSANTIPHTNYM